LHTGSPVLVDALANFDCAIDSIQTVGTHDILICRILVLQQRPQNPGLVYFKRAYHAIGQLDFA
jgi:flavin reductase